MSVSNPRGPRKENPIKVRVRLNGQTGKWKLYDSESKKESEMGGTLECMVLDSNVAKISGYNAKEKASVNSGYFRTTEDNIMIYVGSEKVLEGQYKDQEFRERLQAKGGKYTIVLPVITTKGVPLIIELRGGIMSNFIEYKQKVNMDQNPFIKFHSAYQVTSEAGFPYFTMKVDPGSETNFPKDIWNIAMERDKEFQKYMGDEVIQALPSTKAQEEVKTANDIASEVLAETSRAASNIQNEYPGSLPPEEEVDDLPF